ncbi:hypothetical protein G5I_06712 [Acromyrmex echinatior]|uniref:Uncharacterized protein n=1 Tax=Acromyrmex echinatior TaxID=103372 RepID=F4WLT1_ACREC|nr:hypothetical protein G5I_06712 [Acromyrmex echinatior]
MLNLLYYLMTQPDGNDGRGYGRRSGDRNQTRGIGMAVTRRYIAACMLLTILSLLVETGEVNATMRFGWGLVSSFKRGYEERKVVEK